MDIDVGRLVRGGKSGTGKCLNEISGLGKRASSDRLKTTG